MSLRQIRILAVDGGGIRGLIPSMLLAELEARAGRPMHEIFDVVAGTSTGSLIAAMLTTAKPRADRPHTCAELYDYYQGPTARIFFERSEEYERFEREFPDKRWPYPEYPASSHRRGVHRVISRRATLAGALTHLTIPYFDLRFTPPRARTFSRRKARTDPQEEEFPMRQVVRAASTFPGYFPTWVMRRRSGGRIRPLDGGVFAINPAMAGMTHAIRLLPQTVDAVHLERSKYEFVVVSLGTGYHNTVIRGTRRDEMRTWGVARWSAPMVAVMWEGQSAFVHQQMQQLFADQDSPFFGETPFRYYYRFQARMNREIAFDDASQEALAELQAAARTMIEQHSEAIDEVVGLLEGPKVLA